jgi:hypothetical protein
MKRKNKFGAVKTEIYSLRGGPRIRSLTKKSKKKMVVMVVVMMMMMMRKKEEGITFHCSSTCHYFFKQPG